MNSFFFLSVVLAATTVKGYVHKDNWNEYMKGHMYFIFPGDDRVNHLVDAMEPINSTLILTCSGYMKCNSYWLYTRSNPKDKQILRLKDKNSVRQSHFDPDKVTVFTSHGWLGHATTEMNLLLTEAFLEKDDVNVIVLDWSPLAKSNYVTATAAVPKVGEMYGQFISWLSEKFDMSLDKIHLVGHSLGGHVVGNAGKALKGRAKRMTVLDPAGPMWDLYNQYRVSHADARYVEVIHTNAFGAGYAYPLGHSDHYPNGGSVMPGCPALDLSCHHSMSWRYMVSSIKFNRLIANQCKNRWNLFTNLCNGPIGKMGNSDLHKKQDGLYRGKTKAKYPYC